MTAGDIAAIRAEVGEGFRLWDGSSRNVAASMSAGASGVVATPLSTLPDPFPDVHDLEQLQATFDVTQARIDALPDRPQRSAWLHEEALAKL